MRTELKKSELKKEQKIRHLFKIDMSLKNINKNRNNVSGGKMLTISNTIILIQPLIGHKNDEVIFSNQ